MVPNDSSRKGLFGRLTAGLARTRQGLVGQIERLFTGHTVDAASLEALEELLIAADLGPALAEQIVAPLRGRLGRRDLSDAGQVEAAIKAEILAVLRSTSPSAAADRLARPQVFLFLGVNGSGKTTDRKSTRLNSSHIQKSRMPSSA